MCAKLSLTQYAANQPLQDGKIASVARIFTEQARLAGHSVQPHYLKCVICWPASGKGGTDEKEGANNLGFYHA